MAHLLANVDLRLLLPRAEGPIRFGRDYVHVRADLIAVKRRLQNPAAFPVPRLVEGQDTISHKLPQHGCSNIAPKAVLLNYEDLFDQVGIVDEVRVLMKQAEV